MPATLAGDWTDGESWGALPWRVCGCENCRAPYFPRNWQLGCRGGIFYRKIIFRFVVICFCCHLSISVSLVCLYLAFSRRFHLVWPLFMWPLTDALSVPTARFATVGSPSRCRRADPGAAAAAVAAVALAAAGAAIEAATGAADTTPTTAATNAASPATTLMTARTSAITSTALAVARGETCRAHRWGRCRGDVGLPGGVEESRGARR